MVLKLFSGQGQPILSETESEQARDVLENKNLCALPPKFLSAPQASTSGRTNVKDGFSPLQGSRDHKANTAFGMNSY